MNVLIACECSGVVRRAFRARGHNAWSCDLKASEDGDRCHFRDDALEVMKRGFERNPWDLVIAHPVCTRLANSGSLRLYIGGKFENGIDQDKWADMVKAAWFFEQFFVLPKSAPVKRLCVENPVQHIHAREAHDCGKQAQIIQPFNFGEDASKATGLWLRGLPALVTNPALYIAPRWVCQKCGHTFRGRVTIRKWKCPSCFNGSMLPRWSNQTDSGQNKLAPSEHRAADRSRTYPGIASAMAEQWGSL